MNGFINVLKPTGLTSSDVVVRLRGKVKPNKIGHMGTLDPGASGVLPIAIGKATRLFNFMLEKTKKYRACFCFGTETDTLDSYGVITGKAAVNFSADELNNALKMFVGEIIQTPPRFSAININGERAYDLARMGKEFEIQPKAVTVYEFKLLNKLDDKSYVFDITCSGGTYIRSLVKDLAESLGTKAYLSSLIRLQSGMFKIEDSLMIDEIDDIEKLMMPIEKVLGDIPRYDVNVNLYKDLENGVKLTLSDVPCAKFFTVYCQNELFGLGKIDEQGRLVVDVNLR